MLWEIITTAHVKQNLYKQLHIIGGLSYPYIKSYSRTPRGRRVFTIDFIWPLDNSQVRLRDNNGRKPSEVAANEDVRKMLIEEEHDLIGIDALSKYHVLWNAFHHCIELCF